MAVNNPAFNNDAFRSGGSSTVTTPSAEQLDALYAQPSATPSQTDRMSVEDTILKSAIAFGVLAVGAVAGFMLGGGLPLLMIVAGIAGFGLALVNIFKKEPSPGLILGYAGAQGFFVGALSAVLEARYPGVVSQAVLATLVVVGVTLALFASGKVRASKRATKIFMIAIVAYAVFSLVNFFLSAFGVVGGEFGLRSTEITLPILGTVPLGAILGVLAIVLGAYSLVLDFDFVQQGVKNGAPRKFGWTGVFGIMLTVVWLYVEILRLLAILRE
ncbi:Bax inhibitor-1/YccA family protein [Mycetocola reblochoni]|uniref:Bax inhibitor-1/YccA family protein n=2 Tax=Mycetocola reblochoni TaxID=331618 RepID=A0A3L6ZMU9_9MICO|nr:Bax inhibitor-1/YccA family protein [Mycetocola reblochoni]RLP69220.1 Bax inhibitor-1/YccA family protein [Mycetocola reblochoni]SJN41428.1 putative integral membrane protein [Mycetocola reblochoni REB411]